MNEVSNFSVDVATIFFLVMFVCHLFNRANHWSFSDKFVIAEYEDHSDQNISHSAQINANIVPPSVPKKKNKKKKQSTTVRKKKSNIKAARKPSPAVNKTPQRNKNGYTDLQQDCFDALKSLGIKGVRERKFIVSNTFNQHNPKTVQDFLKVALHRGGSL